MSEEDLDELLEAEGDEDENAEEEEEAEDDEEVDDELDEEGEEGEEEEADEDETPPPFAALGNKRVLLGKHKASRDEL